MNKCTSPIIRKKFASDALNGKMLLIRIIENNIIVNVKPPTEAGNTKKRSLNLFSIT